MQRLRGIFPSVRGLTFFVRKSAVTQQKAFAGKGVGLSGYGRVAVFLQVLKGRFQKDS